MSKSQRNICVLVCLLILLIILCTFTHMGSIKVAKPTPANAADPQSVVAPTASNPVNFSIVKEDQKLSLKGNLDQQSHYERLITALDSKDLTKEVTIDDELAPANEVISLTEKLLVSFRQNYNHGSIRYQDGQLIVDGIVNNRVDKNHIATLLANSAIPSVDNTKVVESIEVPKAVAPVEVSEVNESNITVPASIEVNDSSLPTVSEVNQTLPVAPEVNVTLPETPEVTEVESEEVKQIEAKIQEIINFENINFELNKADLTSKSLATIEKIATVLKENNQFNVEIGGHTDSSGDDNHNLILSQERVDMVKQELIKLGIAEGRMTSIGYGETRPLISNDTKENREKNRRVEFNIIGE